MNNQDVKCKTENFLKPGNQDMVDVPELVNPIRKKQRQEEITTTPATKEAQLHFAKPLELISPIVKKQPQEARPIGPVTQKSQGDSGIADALISPIVKKQQPQRLQPVPELEEPQAGFCEADTRLICPIIKKPKQELPAKDFFEPTIPVAVAVKEGNKGALDHSIKVTKTPIKVSSEAKTDADEEAFPIEYDCRDGKVFYWDMEREKYIPLCNYIPKVKCLEIHYYKDRAPDKKLRIWIGTPHRTEEVVILIDDLGLLTQTAKRQVPEVALEPSATKAAQRLEYYISGQIAAAERVEIICYSGWCLWRGNHYYIHDGIDISGIQCRSGRAIFTKGKNAYQSACEALKFLDISKKYVQTYIPFIFAHIGLLFSLFQDADCSPQFLLFINGTTGSLKTAVSKTLFHVFNSSPPRIAASFKDTVSALEFKMRENVDCVLLLDDFHPASSRSEEADMNNKLETIIRFYGDGIGKARANCKMDSISETKPHGVCAITGEDVGGSLSSQLRCLMIDVRPGDYAGERLRYFQENPEVLPAHYAHFLQYVERNYNELVSLISDKFKTYRAHFSQCIRSSLRLVDSGAYLATATDILNKYLLSITPPGKSLYIAEGYLAIIAQAIQNSEEISRGMSPAVMFLGALCSMYDLGEKDIADNEQTYVQKPENYLGFVDRLGQFWMVNKDAVYPLVKAYWQKRGKYFSLSLSKVSSALYDAGCLEVYENADGSKRYQVRSSLGSRNYFLKVSIARMREILEEV